MCLYRAHAVAAFSTRTDQLLSMSHLYICHNLLQPLIDLQCMIH